MEYSARRHDFFQVSEKSSLIKKWSCLSQSLKGEKISQVKMGMGRELQMDEIAHENPSLEKTYIAQSSQGSEKQSSTDCLEGQQHTQD